MTRIEFLVHIILLALLATFFGAPLLMMSVNWWVRVFGLTMGRVM